MATARVLLLRYIYYIHEKKIYFIMARFKQRWCYFALQYEKAAAELSSQSPPIFLAKIDASEESNKGIANDYKIQGFPTIKILRKGGKSIQDYNGPREAAGIVTYVKKQSGPASAEIKSADGAGEVIGEKSVVAVSESVSHVITFSIDFIKYCNG